MKKYLALAYYLYTPITSPQDEVEKHKKFFSSRDVSGRIYISEEGINGQMSGEESEALAYIKWFRSDPRFSTIHFKIQEVKENLFPRMTVKTRKELVAMGEKGDPCHGGKHLSPKEWKEMLEKEDVFLLDVRNQYEWAIGHFEGAHLPPLKYFRDFPKYAEKLKKTCDNKKTKVMMYCTGGIRCEVYSAILKKKGFENVYQLDGGVIAYGQKEGSKHWKGKLFVFDDRLAIPIDGKEAAPIAKCQFCSGPTDTYYNCGNMDCNALFLACEKCIEAAQGACSASCENAKRLRPHDGRSGNKPFRKYRSLTRE